LLGQGRKIANGCCNLYPVPGLIVEWFHLIALNEVVVGCVQHKAVLGRSWMKADGVGPVLVTEVRDAMAWQCSDSVVNTSTLHRHREAEILEKPFRYMMQLEGHMFIEMTRLAWKGVIGENELQFDSEGDVSHLESSVIRNGILRELLSELI
jgi:hypothetical protein